MLTTAEVAHKLIEYVREGAPEKARDELYSPDVISVEANPNSPDIVGLESIKKKNAERNDLAEIHAVEISDPLITKNYFVVTYDIDATYPELGERSSEDEVAIYRVKHGKIVREEYVYDMPDDD